MMELLRDAFSMRSVRKKVLALSKVLALLLVVFYVVLVNLPIERDWSFALWVVFVVVAVLGYDRALRSIVTDPVDELCAASQRFAHLKFSAPSTVRSHDEFGVLSENLNTMARGLKRTLEDLEASKAKLERDVGRERALLEERKELVDGLSHEMKTPISIIRAYAEGLEDTEDVEKRGDYTRMIITETERMTDLITALLDLSALESGAAALALETFDLAEMVETVAGRLLVDVPDADFELEFELPDEPVIVRSDRFRMEQVLGNLIINAKNHVKASGIVRLKLEDNGGTARFSVFNQGARIPAEDLDRVWDRFYRGRAKAVGGSGLGLSIVAQVLSMQNIPYHAVNQRGGVLFDFEIPVAR